MPSVGWGVLHLFCRARAEAEAKLVAAAVAEFSGAGPDNQVVSFAVLGHKGELGFMALAPDLWGLQRLQSARVAAGLDPGDSSVALTDVSEYRQGRPEEMLEARLH